MTTQNGGKVRLMHRPPLPPGNTPGTHFCMGEGRGVHRVLVGNLGERAHWGDPDVDGRIILRWTFGKWEGVDTVWSSLRIGTDGG